MSTAFRSPGLSQTTMVTVPASSQANPTTAQPINYVFDCTVRIEHRRETQKTQHPVQTGSAISDHAFNKPTRVVLEIGMSDAVQAYSSSMWPQNGNGKSMSAYQTFQALDKGKTLLSLTTRLANYPSMLIVGIQADDTVETWAGLKALITFEELFLGQVGVTSSSSVVSVPARPQTTNTTGVGNLQTMAPSAALTAQHHVSEDQVEGVSGAGTWSSNILQ